MILRPLALALAGLAVTAASAAASTIPLVDVPPGLRVISAGANPYVLHLAGDYAFPGGWIVGGTGSFDISGVNQRESYNMGAVRVTRRLGGTFPFSYGVTLSAGMNLVDPDLPAPIDAPAYTTPYLFWVQPAFVMSTTLFGDFFNDNLWVRGSLGPVLNRWTAGTYFLPYIAPNVELAYRLHPAHELVIGGGMAPWGLGWRGAF